MAYQIEYAYVSHTGRMRNKNEDNFWCCGKTLCNGENGTEGIQHGSIANAEMPLFAVFDGMGGESCGEVASSLAAAACGGFYQDKKKNITVNPKEFLHELCEKMNTVVCDYSQEHKIRSMGSTAAILAFDSKHVYVCNLGDSRIYQVQQGVFQQISADHVLEGGFYGKAPLTQYLGIPKEKMGLEPYAAKMGNLSGNRYLVCSDGVTDMLEDEEIASILGRNIPVEETAELLLEKSLEKGGRDNITLIICAVSETKGNWFKQLWGEKRK